MAVKKPTKTTTLDLGEDESDDSSSTSSSLDAAGGKSKANGGPNYRDSWKKRNDEKNTMVFNFVGSKKDTTHIENDGRDISRRGKGTRKSKAKVREKHIS